MGVRSRALQALLLLATPIAPGESARVGSGGVVDQYGERNALPSERVTR